MPDRDTHVVTGAFGYTGSHIARRLLAEGASVRTLTSRRPPGDGIGQDVEVHPYSFDDPGALAASLAGADTLFNTYWVRFARGQITHDVAVRNIQTLLGAAAEVGIRRVVHISITNASVDSPLPYFRGKALAERAVRESGLSHAILRPAIVFGPDDILINNIAWMLRRFPVHPVPGSGEYRVQPVHVEDLAELAVGLAAGDGDVEMDAVGPEVFAYGELVRLMARKVGSSARVVRLPSSAVMLCSRLMGLLVRDVVLTREEIDGLTADLLVSRSGAEPLCPSPMSQWLERNARDLGRGYRSELRRHYD